MVYSKKTGQFEPVQYKKFSALILDDHSLIREIIRSHLMNIGVRNITVASTAAEGERHIRGHHPDLVVVDWVLPGGESGYSMMKRMRQDTAFDDIAFVMVTGQSDLKHMDDAMMAGATSYIIKPIIATDFIRIVDTALEWIEMIRMSKGLPPR